MTENAADLIITIKSIWNGELPNSDAILLFEKIQESFNASIKSINPKLSKGKYPVLITKMKTGSTNVEWNYQRNEKKQPDMFDNEELGSKAFKLMCENVEMMSKEKNDGIDEQIIQPIADMQRIFSKHNQINTLYLYFQRINKKMSINKNKCLKTIESIQKKKLIQKENSKQMKIIGTLKEIDTRNEGGCIIESPFLGDVKCSYPSELEKQICSMIAPPRQDVIC